MKISAQIEITEKTRKEVIKWAEKYLDGKIPQDKHINFVYGIGDLKNKCASEEASYVVSDYISTVLKGRTL